MSAQGAVVSSLSRRLIVAVDVDEVLAAFIPAVADFHNAVYSTSLCAASFHSYEFHKVWGGSTEESSEKMYAFFDSSHFKERIDPIPGAREALIQLKESFELHIVTARQYIVQEQTLSWIERHFPDLFTAVHFGNQFSRDGVSRSKAQICREIHASALIDDNLTYAIQCVREDIPVLLFGDYAWNQLSSMPNSFSTTDIRLVDFEQSDSNVYGPINGSSSCPEDSSGRKVIYRTASWDKVPAAIEQLLRVPTRIMLPIPPSVSLAATKYRVDRLVVAAVQMCSTNNKLLNLQLTHALVERAVRERVDVGLVCLPECSAFMGITREETLLASEEIDPSTSYPKDQCWIDFMGMDAYSNAAHPTGRRRRRREGDTDENEPYDGIAYINYVAGLCEIAFKHNVWISVGGFPERVAAADQCGSSPPADAVMANSHLLISSEGRIASPVYRKLHLFDAPLVNLFESKTAGNHMVLADMNHQWQLGLTICYDLRFPELYQALRCPHAIPDGRKGEVMLSSSSSDPRTECDVILVPSAFTCKTGEAHWEILLRARAIETQSYVIAAAQSGQHNEKRTSYGHTMIIDPWGSIVAQLHAESEGICFGVLDREVITSTRRDMPVQDHKRRDVY